MVNALNGKIDLQDEPTRVTVKDTAIYFGGETSAWIPECGTRTSKLNIHEGHLIFSNSWRLSTLGFSKGSN
jgi:hypothetical protein